MSRAIGIVGPLQAACIFALFVWAVSSVKLGRILRETKTFEDATTEPQSLTFMRAVTAAVSGWSTMCLNIADLKVTAGKPPRGEKKKEGECVCVCKCASVCQCECV